MALCSKVVYFIRLYSLYDTDKRTAVGHITPMQIDAAFLLHITHPFVKVQMVDASGIE